MPRFLFAAGLGAVLSAGAAQANPPAVAVDIAPVHSLVATVMEGVATPDLIVQPGASPHGYSMRPSEARALQNADLVFWVSAGLTPWLANSIDALSSDEKAVELLKARGTLQLELEDDHGDADHGHDHSAGQEDGHAIDPHGWLDPRNAMTWMTAIASELSEADPENAEIYQANAARGLKDLADMNTEIKARLAPVHQSRFVTFHDAYQYFETAFELRSAGSISISDASAPSPSRIAAIRNSVSALGVRCVLTEPQFNTGLVETVMQGTEVRTAEIDPLGTGLTLGPDLYPQLIRNIADTLATCLAP